MALSGRALSILERMEPRRGYEPTELRVFAPDLSLEDLQDVMRELWVHRQVERVGYSGWRRERSASPAAELTRRTGVDDRGQVSTTGRNKAVRPEDFFDHSAFEDMFK